MPIIVRHVVLSGTDMIRHLVLNGLMDRGHVDALNTLQSIEGINGRSRLGSKELSARVSPAVLLGTGNIETARGYQRQQLMLVKGQKILVAGIEI